MKPESIDQRTKARPVATLAHDYPKGMLIEWHAHDRGQLIYARSGIMTVMTAEGSWVVPPHRAVWVPATTDHAIQCGTRLSMRTLYVAQGAAPRLPQTCAVVQVSPLLRELIVALVEAPGSSRRRAHLTVLILDEIRATPVAPLHLPEPRDARLRRLTAALAADPGDRTDLGAWGREVGASSRTLTRLFLRETGMTFRQWQRQARLLAALVKLAEGEPVTQVALDLGYDSPSAFISAFRRALGASPRRYFEASQ